MTSTKATAVVLVAALSAFAVWGAVDPRGRWRTLRGRRRDDPGGHEPSETGYLVTRIGSLVAVVCFGWVFVFVVTTLP